MEKITLLNEMKENINTIAWASCFVIGMLCVLVYGIAWFGHVEVTNEDIYNRRHMAKEIKDLSLWKEKFDTEYLNHTHIYSTGKPRL